MGRLALNLNSIFLNKRFNIILLGLVAAIGIGFIFVFMPDYDSLQKLKIRLNKENMKLSEIKNEISISGEVKSGMVTDLAGVALALDEITAKANQFGVKFDSQKQSEPIDIGGNFKILPITIESTCDFRALGDFLLSLENLRQSVVVVNRLQVQKDKTPGGKLKVSIDLGMYLLL